MRETLDMARAINAEWANFYCAMAYPGSQLHKEAKPEDLPDEWIGYSQHSYETQPLPTKTLSQADVLRMRDNYFDLYFTDPMYLKMMTEKFGYNVVNQIERMTKIKLKRKLLE